MARWMDRWAARAQRKSDERAKRWQKRRQEQIRSGQVTSSEERFNLLCEVILLLTGDPVSGPDGVPVFICLSERRWSPRPKLPMPESWLRAIASERTLTGQAARVIMVGSSPDYVHAYAMSGPPHSIRRSFRVFGGPTAALAYVLALAKDVRSRGVKALS